MELYHGPEALVLTCFRRAISGVMFFTSKVSVAWFPVFTKGPVGRVIVPLTALVVLTFEPIVIPVTVTLKVQLPLPARVTPLSAIVSGAVTVNVPVVPQIGVVVEDATVKPAGRVSVKFTLVSGRRFGFVIVKDRVEVSPVKMISGTKLFAITGGWTT